jgi:seryl-tRNA synthetase
VIALSALEEQLFHDELVERGLILPLGVPGVFGRGALLEEVIERFNQLVDRATAGDGAEPLHFPPVIPRRLLEQSGFVDSFPHLAGAIFSSEGAATDVALASAACHPVYPALEGVLPAGGRLVSVHSYCFRREPSADPARMQSFRMRELVRLGAPEEVLAWREAWISRGLLLLRALGLVAEARPASDPFFGRSGKLLAAAQVEQKLKFEITAPIANRDCPTAIMSFNYHRDHFSSKFNIHCNDGQTAHTACVGFGLERIALALFRAHGFEPSLWPAEARARLWP